jgi:putative DNA primase/helicase
MGDRVIAAGERKPVGQFESGGYIYPAAVPLHIDYTDPIGSREAARISALCDMLMWDRPINGRLLAGWLAVAPICGALSWRPHIWLSGPSGSGKSWIADNIMRPILGRIGLFVQSDTTEAGIRQALGYDARPVIFDEAEGETERAQVRMQQVMALMRQSSSDNGSVIVKGSVSGNVKIYCIRSCFAFSSIGVGVRQHSDTTRVTVLTLKKDDGPGAEERFAALRAATSDLLAPAFISGLHARMIALIPTIRDNSETFASAAAKHIGSQRMGDQLGALLAGAYALHSDKIISRKDADAWVAKQDWAEQQAIQDMPDEMLCLQRILQHVIRVPEASGRIAELSVAEMIQCAGSSLDPDSDPYRMNLLRLGIRPEKDSVIIANNHSGIENILSGTPWHDWGRILKRLPGARSTSQPIRFAGIQARATIVPMEVISN